MSAVAIASIVLMGLGALLMVRGVIAVSHDLNNLAGAVAVPIGAIIFSCGAIIGGAKIIDWWVA